MQTQFGKRRGSRGCVSGRGGAGNIGAVRSGRAVNQGHTGFQKDHGGSEAFWMQLGEGWGSASLRRCATACRIDSAPEGENTSTVWRRKQQHTCRARMNGSCGCRRPDAKCVAVCPAMKEGRYATRLQPQTLSMRCKEKQLSHSLAANIFLRKDSKIALAGVVICLRQSVHECRMGMATSK